MSIKGLEKYNQAKKEAYEEYNKTLRNLNSQMRQAVETLDTKIEQAEKEYMDSRIKEDSHD